MPLGTDVQRVSLVNLGGATTQIDVLPQDNVQGKVQEALGFKPKRVLERATINVHIAGFGVSVDVDPGSRVRDVKGAAVESHQLSEAGKNLGSASWERVAAAKTEMYIRDESGKAVFLKDDDSIERYGIEDGSTINVAEIAWRRGPWPDLDVSTINDLSAEQVQHLKSEMRSQQHWARRYLSRGSEYYAIEELPSREKIAEIDAMSDVIMALPDPKPEELPDPDDDLYA